MKANTTGRPDALVVRLKDTRVGTLTRLVDDTIVFAFDPTYEENRQRPVLSQSFKTGNGSLTIARPRTGPSLSPFFSNLLPEGPLRDFLADKLSIDPKREFFLLAALGLDLPGAVIVEPIGELSSTADQDHNLAEKQSKAVLRFSLAGVQLKFSAILERPGTFTVPADGTGGSWIVKLPSESHPHLPEIEHAMLSFAKLVGIEVPEIKLVPTISITGLPEQFGNSIADSLAVKRFDRKDDGTRIHIEDFAQVYDVYPKDKYEKAGYSHIAKVLWAEASEHCFTEFVRRLVFTVAIGNGDMHLKNWSLIYTNPTKPALSPAYDFVPTIGYISRETLGLNLGGTKEFNDVSLEKFKKMAQQAGASERLTANIVNETCERILASWAKDRYTIGLPAEMRSLLDQHMKSLPIFKPYWARSETTREPLPWLKDLTIAEVEFDPIVPDRTMILEAASGNTTAVNAPERMEDDLIDRAARQGLHWDLGKGPVRAFVGEHLYREWRQINFITIEPIGPVIFHEGVTTWRGEIQSYRANFPMATWRKIVSAFERKAMERFDVLQGGGSIKTFNAKVLEISDIKRDNKTGNTEASVKLQAQEEQVVLDPHVGISYLSSDFELRELRNAIEAALREHDWEVGIFSEPSKLIARKKIEKKIKGETEAGTLEAEIIFQTDKRKTSLCIRITDMDYLLGSKINNEARQMRQQILEYLPIEPD